jgi:hypothetical protein
MTSSTPRPFRFGVTTTGIASRAAWQDHARRLEAEGWSTLRHEEETQLKTKGAICWPATRCLTSYPVEV